MTKVNTISVIKQYKVIGNTVPPVLIWNVLKPISINGIDVLKDKNVLISLVKTDNMEQYLDRSARVYYTGKNPLYGSTE